MNTDDNDPGGYRAKEDSRYSFGGAGGNVCASCGSSLGLAGPDGGCLNCLAQFALSPDDDGEEGGGTAMAPRSFGHFEVVTGSDGWPVKLGRGAMGVTYRARDTALHTEVALKVISISVAGHPAARAAFLREARAAARLRHANVASVFHYGEQDGECFYAMELVEGETLEARLRREGPLPSALVLEIGRQVAGALMEAEALGIVHRDLKPSNIMFASRRGAGAKDPPHIKVIDFGLAQAVDLAEAEDGQSVVAGGFIGTPSFASPEQFARDKAQPVDTRSDIYSLGVTLWFLLCAKLPFTGTTLAEIHRQQIAQTLPSEQLHLAGVPEPITRLLAVMLAVDPVGRPASARTLIDALGHCQAQLTEAPRAARRRRQIRLVMASTLALLLLAGAWVWWERTRPMPPPPDRSLAVLPFENLSPNPADAFFTTGVQDQITADLARIAALKIIGPESTKPYEPDKRRDLARVGRELGVRHLLTGSLERRGEQVHVAVSLTDVHNLSHPWKRQYDLRLPEVFAVQGDVTRAVAGQLQASLSPVEKAIINRPPTTNLQAYDLYLRAQQDSPEPPDSEQKVREKERRTIDLLEQAVALDPDFALAYCSLAMSHDTMYFYRTGSSPEELSVDHRGLAEKYLAKAQRLQPDLGETHLAASYHFYSSTNDYEQARYEANAARRTLPHNAELELLAGRIARRQGRWNESILAMERAADLEPRDGDALYLLTGTYHVLRRYHDLDRTIARLQAQSAASNDFTFERALIALETRADLGPLRAMIATPSSKGVDDEKRLFLALFEGDVDGVERILAASKQSQFMIEGVPYPRSWYQALAARMRGHDDAARDAFAAARAELEKEVRLDPTEGLKLSTLAIIDAGLGRNEDAVREAQRACELCPYEGIAMDAPIVRCNLAVVHAWAGESDLAFAELNKVVDLPFDGSGWPNQPTYGDCQLNPLWAPLRADPRFKSLVQRLASRPAP